MFLFSIGITKGKWGTLITNLLAFKRHYDANDPVADVLPELAAQHPERYRNVGLRDLGTEMFDYLKKNDPGELLNRAYETLPAPEMTPREAFQKIVTNDVELVPVDKIARPHRRERGHAVPAGHSHADVGRELRRREQPPDRLPARPPDLGPPVPRLRARHRGRRDRARQLPRPVRPRNRETSWLNQRRR